MSLAAADAPHQERAGVSPVRARLGVHEGVPAGSRGTLMSPCPGRHRKRNTAAVGTSLHRRWTSTWAPTPWERSRLVEAYPAVALFSLGHAEALSACCQRLRKHGRRYRACRAALPRTVTGHPLVLPAVTASGGAWHPNRGQPHHGTDACNHNFISQRHRVNPTRCAPTPPMMRSHLVTFPTVADSAPCVRHESAVPTLRPNGGQA